MRKAILAPVTLAASVLLVSACDWNSPKDYQAKDEYNAFLKKQNAAQAESQNAAAAGGQAAGVVPGKQTYDTYCVACHGANGAADGAAAQAMNPKPRNLTDKAWQAKVTDEHLAKVIKEGGPAVGLSATMAPWGAVVSDAELKNLVQYVRSFGK